MNYSYKIYSLTIKSEIEFPEFVSYEHDIADTDVFIKTGKTPKKLTGANIVDKVFHESTKNKLLMHLKGIGSMYVENGNEITVEPETNTSTSLNDMKSHVRSRGLAAIIYQRNWMVLHSSVIVHNKQAILFIGESGAGKSTTAGAFIKKGYDFMSDDLGLIKQNNDGEYLLYPAYPNLRLWETSIDLLETEDSFTKGNRIRKDIDKYFMTPKGNFLSEPVPISHIYILSGHDAPEILFNQMSNFEKMNQLTAHTFAEAQLEGLGAYEAQFKTISHLINHVNIKMIKRPLGLIKDDFWKMIDQIEMNFKS